jgi:hypothetical protein
MLTNTATSNVSTAQLSQQPDAFGRFGHRLFGDALSAINW